MSKGLDAHFVIMQVETIDAPVDRPAPRNLRWHLRTLATYIIAPVFAAVAFVVVAFAEAYPAVVFVVITAAIGLAKPAIDWVRAWRRPKAEPNVISGSCKA